MKKNLIIVLVVTSLFTACGLDKQKCLESVKQTFPDKQVYTESGGSCSYFVVRDSINIYSVVTMGLFSPRVTGIKLLTRTK
jgi:hypothetical protein